MEFDFQKYIQSKNGGRAPGERSFRDYAFSRDVRVLRTLERTRFVRLALDGTARLEKEWIADELLAKAERVGPGAYPRVRDLSHNVAKALGMPTPVVFITDHIDPLLGTVVGFEGKSHILVARRALDLFDSRELGFLIGAQCGHLQNGHVPYLTAELALDAVETAVVRWAIKPAELALATWHKIGDLTADRAGLIACRDLEVATTALDKMAKDADARHAEAKADEGEGEGEGEGSNEDDEDDEDDVEDAELVDDDDDDDDDDDVSSSDLGGQPPNSTSAREIRARITALELFAGSEYYRRLLGESGGDTLLNVDKEVEERLNML